MVSDSNNTLRYWLVLALRIVLLATIFIGARYWSIRLAKKVDSSSPQSVSMTRGTSTQSPASIKVRPAVANLSQAKADLLKILNTQGKYNRERALLSMAANIDPTMLEVLLADLVSNPNIGNNKQAITILAVQLAKSDPQASLDVLRSIHDPAEKEELLAGIFDAWSAVDSAGALAAISQLPAGVNRRGPLYAVLSNMMLQDPKEALSLFFSQSTDRYSPSFYTAVFAELASKDPSVAAAAALNMTPSLLRNTALQIVVTTWAQQDPASALAWVNALPAGSQKDGVLATTIVALSQQDPTSAVEYASRLPNGPIRDYTFKQISSNWAQADPAGLLAWATGNLTGTAYADATQNALRVMGQTDPAAAAAALAQIADPNVANPAFQQLAWAWGAQDVNAALAWAQSLPADNAAQRNSAITGVLESWSNTDPAAAASYIQRNLATDPSFKTLATQMVNTWGRSDPQAALAWAENLPAGSAQNNAVNAAIAQLAKFDPQTAWQDAQQLSGNSGNTVMVNVINAWASQQPEQAAAALANLPTGKTLDTATGDVAKNWLNQDPNAASQWINTLPQGSARDAAVNQIITTVGKNDPAAAFNWATTINNETTRNAQVVKLAGQWSSINPAAAAAAAQNALGNLTGLTPAQQTALQEIINKAPQP